MYIILCSNTLLNRPHAYPRANLIVNNIVLSRVGIVWNVIRIGKTLAVRTVIKTHSTRCTFVQTSVRDVFHIAAARVGSARV